MQTAAISSAHSATRASQPPNPAPVAPAASGARSVELGTMTLRAWNSDFGGTGTRTVPMRGEVVRSGITSLLEGQRLLLDVYREGGASAREGYAALVRDGATWDAVWLSSGISAGRVVDVHAAPGIVVDAVWYIGGYPFPAWERAGS